MEPAAITVDTAHVRGLHIYGQGWALMWSGDNVLLTRPEEGDDDRLREVIIYEGLQHMRWLADESKPHGPRIAELAGPPAPHRAPAQVPQVPCGHVRRPYRIASRVITPSLSGEDRCAAEWSYKLADRTNWRRGITHASRPAVRPPAGPRPAR